MRFKPIFALLIACAVSLGTVKYVSGQANEGVPKLPDSVRNSPSTTNVPVVGDDQIQREQAAAAAKMRQEQILRDSEKLFQLTAELKDQIDKANGQILSVDAIKRAEQIEKLAHSLKGKLKLAY